MEKSSGYSDYRYPGPGSYQDTEVDRLLFRGREGEKQSLFHMILIEHLVVLFAKSGLGKTSLLTAGLMEQLRGAGLVPIMIRFNTPNLSPIEAIYHEIKDYAQSSGLEHEGGVETSLWEYFKTAKFWTSDDKLLTPILILDQFEEIFTLHSADSRKLLIVQLADLVRGRIPTSLLESLKPGEGLPYSETPPRVKIVISIREDFLGQLEEMSSEIPQIFGNSFRLLPLDRGKAQEALVEPAQVDDEHIGSKRFQYDGDAVKAILDFLSKQRDKSEGPVTDAVEPFQLQVLCQHIEKEIVGKSSKEDGEITLKAKDLGGEAGMRRILANFYNNQVKKLHPLWRRITVRRLCERLFISRDGRRRSLEEGDIKRRAWVSKDVLEKLVKNRLLRSEPRLGSRYYELIHDTLIEPIRESRHRRRNRRRRIALAMIGIVLLSLPFSWPKASDMIKLAKAKKVAIEEVRVFERRLQSEVEFINSIGHPKGSEDLEDFRNLKRAYVRLIKFDDLEVVYQRAQQVHPDFKLIYFDFAEALRLKGETGQARTYYKKAFEVESTNPRYYGDVGDGLLDLREYEIAIKSYEKAIQIDRNNADLHYRLGNAYASAMKPQNAMNSYRKALSLKPDLWQADVRLGSLLWDLGNYGEAIRSYKSAFRRNPKDVVIQNALGHLHRNLKQYGDAIRTFELILAADSNHAWGYYGLGWVFFDQRKYGEAECNFQKAIEEDGKVAKFYTALGLVLAQEKKHDDAIKNLEKAIETDPDDLWPYRSLVDSLLTQERSKEAIEYCKQVIQKKPRNAEDFKMMSGIYHEYLYDYSNAYATHAKRIEIYGLGNIDAKGDFAEASLSAERFADALTLANEVYKDENASIEQKLAMKMISAFSLIFQKKPSEAIPLVRQILALHKSQPGYDRSGWMFRGTENFIKTNKKLSQVEKALMLSLISFFQSSPQEANEKFRQVELSLAAYRNSPI